MTIPVILSGGTGSRLWPLSREDFPKQFLPLINEKSLLQNTILRAKELLPQAESIVITCLKEHSFIMQRQLKTLPNINFETFLEPCSKNTAPIVAIIAQHIYHTQDDELMWVMPADHSI
jgi:mannose-1-phosphate guanylyltransferase / mannose-6-phosphate isomerase